MRWPFSNWRRSAGGGDDPPPDEHADGAITPDPSAASPDTGGGPAAWRELPPIQRAVSAAPLTAPSVEFARDLAGRRQPDPMISSLGHAITTGGPAGLVSGIATPLVQRAAAGVDRQRASALPAPAAPDRARGAIRRTTTSAVLPRAGAAPAADPGDSAEATAGPVAEPARPNAPADAPLIPARSLPVVEPAAGTPAIAATRVAEMSAPAPVFSVARVIAAATDAASVDAAGTPRVAADAAGVEPLARPASVSLASDDGSAGQPGDASSGPERPIVARRTLGESRRLGLGAPLAGPPPASGRAGERSDLPLARLPRAAAPGPSTAPEPSLPAVAAARAASMPLPRLVVARASTSATETTPDGGPEVAAASAAPPDGPDPIADGATLGRSFGEEGDSRDEPSIDRSRPLTGATPIGVSRQAIGESMAASDDGVAPGLRAEALPLAPGPAIARPSDALSARSGVDADEPGDVNLEDGAAPPAIHALEGGSASDPSGSGRSSFMSGTALGAAPLVAGRVMRASLADAPAILGRGPVEGPGPVVARPASSSSGATRAGAGPVRTSALGADRPGTPPARGAAVQREMGPALDRVLGRPGARAGDRRADRLGWSRRSFRGDADPATDALLRRHERRRRTRGGRGGQCRLGRRERVHDGRDRAGAVRAARGAVQRAGRDAGRRRGGRRRGRGARPKVRRRGQPEAPAPTTRSSPSTSTTRFAPA